MKKIDSIPGLLLLTGLLFLPQCKKSDDVKPSEGIKAKLTISPATTFQEMIGFGGAFAWYCERVTNSSKKNDIANLLFTDLGIDIIRFKNWYYPDGYPTNKATTSMSDANENYKPGYDATNQLYTLAKQTNPNVKILLSSWGPPASLKGNASNRATGSPASGTLKKDANGFMYDAFAAYWEDILNNTPFNPDYISIQNEPSYINTGWTTCEWAPSETTALPGYDIAFDKVYQKLQSRSNPPMMIGPESANIGIGSAGNTFSIFADLIKNKPSLGMYAYHPYNFGTTTTIDQTTPLLQVVGSYVNKPNIMTEYSDSFSWFTTAQFINNALLQANSSGYIYWKLVWAAPAANATDAAMISITSAGDFTVTPFFYVMKHFAKHIDAGYKRILVSSDNSSLQVSGFINPAKNQITLVIINQLGTGFSVDFEVMNTLIKAINADQTAGVDFYKKLDAVPAGKSLSVPAASITTVVLDI